MLGIKYYLFKILSTRKLKFFLISFLTLSGLFIILKPAYALFGVGDIGIFDLAEVQLGALDWVENIFLRYLWFFTLLLFESMVLVAGGAKILQWAVDLPINLDNVLVLTGWNFIIDLVNLLLVLIFITIALSWILRIETFGMKKALPKLIIVALLVNFSLVFIGIFLDIAEIFQNTLAEAFGGDFFAWTIGPLIESAKSLAAWGMNIFVAWRVFALIPYVNVARLVVIAGLMLTEFLTGGILLKGIFLIFVNFVIGGIFLFYAFLFLARIVVIWLLAIFSPLAFLAYILPTTEKYTRRWLGLLVQWVFLGLLVFFLLGLGLQLFSRVILAGVPIDTEMGTLPSYVYNYLFLIVYLGVVFFFSKWFAPLGANLLLEQLKTMAGRGASVLGKPVGPAFRKWLVEQESKKAGAKEPPAGRLARAKKWGQRADTGIGLLIAKPGRWAYRQTTGTTPEVAVSKDIDGAVKELEERFGKDVKGAASFYSGKFMTDREKMAMGVYLGKTKGAEGLEMLGDKLNEVVKKLAVFAPHKLEDIVKHRQDLIDDEAAKGRGDKEGEEIAKAIQNAMVSKERIGDEDIKNVKDKDIRRMRESGIEIDNQPIEELVKTEEGRIKVIREATYKKAIDALKNDDISTLTDETLNNEKFQETVARYKPIGFIRRLGEDLGSTYVEKVHETAENLTAAEIAKTNPTLLRSAITNPGFKAVFPPIRGAEDDDKIKELVRKAREGRRGQAEEEQGSDQEGYIGGMGPTRR